MIRMRAVAFSFLGLALGFAAAPPAGAYSVLTHEAVVDSVWEPHLVPLLKARFPSATPDDLVRAHAYAYGGTLIQDLGYYPFSSKLFSDLVHYVRAGDFVVNLLDESQNLNELAFALGALAHYFSDRDGHSIGINPAVALTYPDLRKKYGDKVTYAESPAAHLKTEFAFDVVMAVSGRYAPKAYHDFIGFEISKPVLERAFLRTYGLKLDEVFGNLDLALGTFRHSVATIIPNMTKVAWQLKKDEIRKALPGVSRAKFIYRFSGRQYSKEFGNDYRRPGIGTRILAFFLRLIPHFGPFRGLGFKVPPAGAEHLFLASLLRTSQDYGSELDSLQHGKPHLADINLDTGGAVQRGGYTLEDKAYLDLLSRLAQGNFANATPELCRSVLAYYSHIDSTGGRTQADPADLARMLDGLRARFATPAR